MFNSVRWLGKNKNYSVRFKGDINPKYYYIQCKMMTASEIKKKVNINDDVKKHKILFNKTMGKKVVSSLWQITRYVKRWKWINSEIIADYARSDWS